MAEWQMDELEDMGMFEAIRVGFFGFLAMVWVVVSLDSGMRVVKSEKALALAFVSGPVKKSKCT